jgi:hypothetical protein
MMRRLLEYGIGLRQRRLSRLQFDFERSWINLIQRIAGLDLAALLEQALGDNAGDARTHLGNAQRRDAAWQFAHHRMRLRNHRDDADFRGDRAGRSFCRDRFVAAAKERRQSGDQNSDGRQS